MLEWITVLLACQLAGEVLVKALHLPLPGPVGGMALLFCGLVINRGVPDTLGKAADAFLSNLSLLFVPGRRGRDAALQAFGRELDTPYGWADRQHASNHCRDRVGDGVPVAEG